MINIPFFILISLFVIIPLGRKITLFFLSKEQVSIIARLFLYFGIGSGLLGMVVLYVGLLGHLYRKTMVILLATMAVLLFKELIGFIKELFEFVKKIDSKFKLEPIEILIISALIIIWGMSFFGSLSPLKE